MSSVLLGRGGAAPPQRPPDAAADPDAPADPVALPDPGPAVDGPAAAWLAERRDHLNERFERARRRTPALDPDEVLARLATALPALAGAEPAAGRLLDVVYDLVVLHAGRGAFARHPGLVALLHETFPALRPLLLEAPGHLPGALSNAVENLGPVGEPWARALPAVAATLGERPDPDAVLDAGALLAWRLGEARLRVRALERARGLPAGTVRAALALPERADVPTVLERLSVDAWNDPLVEPDRAWRRVGTLGGFTGFDGPFDAPPRLLDGGEPHVLHVVSAGRWYRVDADRYGQHVRPEPDPGLASREAKKPGFFGKLLAGRDEWADPDGTFHLGSGKVPLPEEAGFESWARMGHVLAVARRDSHHVHVYATGAGA